ncbi:hypothetical protein H6G13_22545 [Pseudanabaena sp. FACHB-2040]|nr:hypothetical protein [Pseudanabaena sp. FACHB-2040]
MALAAQIGKPLFYWLAYLHIDGCAPLFISTVNLLGLGHISRLTSTFKAYWYYPAQEAKHHYDLDLQFLAQEACHLLALEEVPHRAQASQSIALELD